uniref:Decapping nuclease n=1 Tax=Chelonoidis abingdonii TaxID=106734 RepID=A0A8C0JG39_CHEAB
MESSIRPDKRSSGATEVPRSRGSVPSASPARPPDPAREEGVLSSLGRQRRTIRDARQLRLLRPTPTRPPQPSFDLRHGYRDPTCATTPLRAGERTQASWFPASPSSPLRAGERTQVSCAVPVPPDTPDGSPDPTGVVNTNEAFCTVVRTRLGSHSLLFAGEVDCTDPRGAWPEPPACYVELKTCKELHSPAQRRSFYRHKLIKWWAQSFLPGVSRIVAGFRAPDGSVAALETFETMKIFQLIRGDRGCWKPAVCVNFCEAFLAFLKSVVTEDDPHPGSPLPPVPPKFPPHPGSPSSTPQSPPALAAPPPSTPYPQPWQPLPPGPPHPTPSPGSPSLRDPPIPAPRPGAPTPPPSLPSELSPAPIHFHTPLSW